MNYKTPTKNIPKIFICCNKSFSNFDFRDSNLNFQFFSNPCHSQKIKTTEIEVFKIE